MKCPQCDGVGFVLLVARNELRWCRRCGSIYDATGYAAVSELTTAIGDLLCKFLCDQPITGDSGSTLVKEDE